MNNKTNVLSMSNKIIYAQSNKANYQMPMQTSDSYLLEPLYQTRLPSNMDVFVKITDALCALTNSIVKNETEEILQRIYKYIKVFNWNNNMTNYLSKLNVTEQDDNSALIEWNFQNFRAGFSIEPIIEESSYYIISEDKSIGSFMADTKKVGLNYDEAVEKIVKYVLENT